jgi:hypothetical protein
MRLGVTSRNTQAGEVARDFAEGGKTMSMLFPIDPTLLTEEKKRRRALEACFGVVRAGMKLGKTLVQRIKSRTAGS